MDLSPTAKAFVLHWGEMGTRWGINRTVAQIHALLYLAPKPVAADDIAATLSVARSNVSNSLRELQGWGVVRVVHVMGDRRDHFECMSDVWNMFQTILDERKKREVDPTVAVLRGLVNEAGASGEDALVRERLAAMLQYFEMMTRWYTQIRNLPTGALRRFVKMGDKLKKLLGGGPKEA
jgi:DNA-binding transcriptional regulator GbsR (MarR family)